MACEDCRSKFHSCCGCAVLRQVRWLHKSEKELTRGEINSDFFLPQIRARAGARWAPARAGWREPRAVAASASALFVTLLCPDDFRGVRCCRFLFVVYLHRSVFAMNKCSTWRNHHDGRVAACFLLSAFCFVLILGHYSQFPLENLSLWLLKGFIVNSSPCEKT